MKNIINENDILEFNPGELEKQYDSEKSLEHLNDNKFFIDYRGKTMKYILEDRGLGDYWSFANTDTHEIVEAPDVNWLFNIIFELTEIQNLPNNLIVSLLEEYFIERKKDIINEWRQLAARYLDLFPEEYENIKNKNI